MLTGLEAVAFDDFQRLETHRPVGGMGGVGPIPVLAMYEYLERSQTPRSDWPLFIELWRAMDGETLSHHAEKMKASMPKSKHSAGSTKPTGGKRIIPKSEYPEA